MWVKPSLDLQRERRRKRRGLIKVRARVVEKLMGREMNEWRVVEMEKADLLKISKVLEI